MENKDDLRVYLINSFERIIMAILSRDELTLLIEHLKYQLIEDSTGEIQESNEDDVDDDVDSPYINESACEDEDDDDDDDDWCPDYTPEW